MLTETFSTCFPLHDVFVSPGVRLTASKTARLSGGAALLVRKKLNSFVKHVRVEFDNCVTLKLLKELTGMTVGCVLIGMYLPPSQSLYYADTEIDNGVSLLEQCIIDILEETGKIPIIIFGDLNARTGNTNAREAALPAGGLIDESVDSDSEDTRFRRTSKDITVNEFGRYLLCVCEQFDLIILNGLMPGGEDGKFTYMAHNGSSTIDYFIMSRSLVHMVSHLHVVSRIESKHAR